MKSKVFILILITWLFLPSFSNTQNQFTEKAPDKFSNSNFVSKKKLFGYIEGNVLLTGNQPYNFEDVENVLVQADTFSIYPDEFGDYQLSLEPGIYDISATLYGYDQQIIEDITIVEGGTISNLDFILPTINGRLTGTIIEAFSCDPIENAILTFIGPDLSVTTGIDGYYEIFVEEGIYDVQIDHPTYELKVIEDIIINVEQDTQQNFELVYSYIYCNAGGGGDEFIDGIEFGDIVNLGTGYNSGYEDFTSMSTVVIPGLTYTLSIHTGNSYTSDDYGIWVDWNQDCVFDELTENVVCGIDVGAEITTWDITVPANVWYGNFIMRVRLKWSGSDCGEPCGYTSYGEVEDYSLIVPTAGYGNIEGYITNCVNGNPIEGAEINIMDWYTTLSGPDGFYSFPEIINGIMDVSCIKSGFCDFDTTIYISECVVTNLDIDICPAQFEVYPDTINLSAFPGSTINFFFDLSNPGDCNVDYTFEGDVNWLNQGVVTSGTVLIGESTGIEFPIFDISLVPSFYEGHVIFNSSALTSPDTLVVILEVLGFAAPINLTGYYDCTDIYLDWEMPVGSFPTSYNLYSDGVLVGNTIESEYYEANVIPEVEYCFQVTAVYEVGESEPTPEFCITVPTPDDLEPFDLDAMMDIPNENDVTLIWEEPESCLFPIGYNVYRDSILINDFLVSQTTYIDQAIIPAFHEYAVTAVYYFGESMFSNPAYVYTSGMDELVSEQYKIFPNPSSEIMYVQSGDKIGTIVIYNIQGHFLQRIDVDQKKIMLDVSQFEPGVYFIELEIEKKSILRKVVVK